MADVCSSSSRARRGAREKNSSRLPLPLQPDDPVHPAEAEADRLGNRSGAHASVPAARPGAAARHVLSCARLKGAVWPR